MIRKDDFVVGVKDSEGNLVTQDGDTFRIPFGSEYSFVIKNVNSFFWAGVEILVDGTPIMGDNKITLKPRDKIEIDRFCIDRDLEKGRKLKFVEKDHEQVQDPTSESNGNVEIKFYQEKKSYDADCVLRRYLSRPPRTGPRAFLKSDSDPQPQSLGGGEPHSVDTSQMGNISANPVVKMDAFLSASEGPVKRAFTYSCDDIEIKYEAIGATIEGETSEQSFQEGHKLDLNDIPRTIISFNLRGDTNKEDRSVENQYKSKVAFILDKSGSMSYIRQETIKAFNDQRAVLLESPENVETSVSLFTFSAKADEPVLFDVPIAELKELTPSDYCPSGSTSMLDSVGKTIERLSALEDAHEKNTSFLLIIISDGCENSSSTYDYEDVSNLICSRQNTGRWTVTYLGANQDLSEISEKMKIDKGNIQIFNADSKGMEDASSMVSAGAKAYTSGLSGGTKCSKGFYSDGK